MPLPPTLGRFPSTELASTVDAGVPTASFSALERVAPSAPARA